MSDTAQKITELLKNIFDIVKEKLHQNMEFEDIIDEYRPYLYDMIGREETAGKKYVGGKLIIGSCSEDYFDVNCELYFLNEQEKWLKISTHSKPQSVRILRSGQMERLLEHGKLIFNVALPDDSRRPVE